MQTSTSTPYWNLTKTQYKILDKGINPESQKDRRGDNSIKIWETGKLMDELQLTWHTLKHWIRSQQWSRLKETQKLVALDAFWS